MNAPNAQLLSHPDPRWEVPPPIQASRRIPRESAALFNGLNACTTLNVLPHPVAARNGHMSEAWQAWTLQMEGQAGLSADLMRTTRRRFEQNVTLLRESLRADPLWRSGAIDPERSIERDDGSLVLGTAALMFWSRRNVVIETTDALEQLLAHSDIGDELPVSLFQPPMPACFIRFGSIFREAVVPAPHQQQLGLHRLQGVYVFDARREQGRSIAIIPVFELPDSGCFGANTIELVIGNEETTLNALIHDVCSNSDQGPHFVSIAQIVAKVFFYLQQAQVEQVDDRSFTTAHCRLGARGAKKAARVLRQLPRLYDRLVLGPQEMLRHHHGELSPHLRRGHFRMQPYGPQSSLRKVIFVAPTWIRADRLAHHGT